MTQDHRLDYDFNAEPPDPWVIPDFRESGRDRERFRGRLPEPEMQPGRRGLLPDVPRFRGELLPKIVPTTGDGKPEDSGPGSGDGPAAPAGDGTGGGSGPPDGGPDGGPAAADDGSGGGPAPADDGGPEGGSAPGGDGTDGGSDRRRDFAAEEPSPPDNAGQDSEPAPPHRGSRKFHAVKGQYSVEMLTTDLSAVLTALREFGQDIDLDEFYHTVSDLLWVAIEHWEDRFPHNEMTIPALREAGPYTEKLLALELDLQETERYLRETEQDPDSTGQKTRSLAVLKSRRTALRRAIRELIEKYVEEGAGAAEQKQIVPWEERDEARMGVVIPKPGPRVYDRSEIRVHTVEELRDQIESRVRRFQLDESLLAMRMDEEIRRVSVAERAIMSDVYQTVEQPHELERLRRYRQELQQKPGTLCRQLIEIKREQVADLEEIPMFVTPGALNEQQKRAENLVFEINLVTCSLRELEQVIDYEIGKMCQNIPMQNQETPEIQPGIELNKDQVDALIAEMRSLEAGCDENAKHAARSMTVLKQKIVGNMRLTMSIYREHLMAELQGREDLIEVAQELVDLGIEQDVSRERGLTKRIVEASCQTFLDQLEEDLGIMQELSQDSQLPSNVVTKLRSAITDIVHCITTIEASRREFLGQFPGHGMASRLRTLLSRPALYKAWVRASLADLVHAQVHAPAEPEHAPGAAAQPAARHPGVAGASIGAGHV